MCVHKSNLAEIEACSRAWLMNSSHHPPNCSNEWFFEVDIYNGHHPTLESQNSSMNDVNYSDVNFPNTLWIRKPDWELAVKSVAFLLVVILGIVGNTLLLTVVLRNRSIQTPTNLLIANMAVADLITLIMLPWIFMLVDCFQNYVLGEFFCRAQGVMECGLLLTGVINLVTVSYDRLVAIIAPLEARLTIHGTHIVIVCTWVVGLILGLPLYFLRNYKERLWLNFEEMYCTEERVIMPIYWHVIIVFVVWLPLIIMVLCYTGLFIKLDRYERKVLRREHPISVGYKTKVARTLFIVVIVFVVCRVPFTALILMRTKMIQGAQTINQVEESYNIIWFVSHYLIIVDAAVNPIIYGLTNENFRRAFRSTALARWLFGSTDVTASTPRTPRQAFKKLEPRDLLVKSGDVKHWFTMPKHLKVKTQSTDCYM